MPLKNGLCYCVAACVHWKTLRPKARLGITLTTSRIVCVIIADAPAKTQLRIGQLIGLLKLLTHLVIVH
jgi:hypothetical protein